MAGGNCQLETGRPVLLVNTNTAQPPIAPLGLDYLADALREQGFEPVLLDLVWQPDQSAALVAALAELRPQAIGLTVRNTDSCYLLHPQSYLPQIRKMVSLIKAHTDAPVVLGGCGYSVFGASVLEAVGADYGIRGDGEEALPALLRALRQQGGALPRSALARIRGLDGSGRLGSGQLAMASPRPGSRRDFVDNPHYFGVGGQGGFETKRGCGLSCIYCADPVAKGRSLRLRRPADVADELEGLLAQAVDVLHTCDSEFNVPPDHAESICKDLIDRNLGSRVQWYAYCQVAGFSQELAGLMRRAGCVGINFGVDAICDEMLERLGRSYRVAEVSEAVSASRRAGLLVMLDLLLGAPGETPQTLSQTVERAKALEPDCVGAALGVRVYPGTPLARMLRQGAPIEDNPNLVGQKSDNDGFLEPVFYIERALGPKPQHLLYDLIGGDQRFFVGDPEQAEANYDYSDNRRLTEAIAAGARGAYWDILRKL